MNKYTKIVPFDIGTERPTIEYTESLKATNADLLEALEELVRDAKRMDERLLKDVTWDNAPKGSIVRADEAIRKATE